MRSSLVLLVVGMLAGCASQPPDDQSQGVPEQRINQIDKDKSPDHAAQAARPDGD